MTETAEETLEEKREMIDKKIGALVNELYGLRATFKGIQSVIDLHNKDLTCAISELEEMT